MNAEFSNLYSHGFVRVAACVPVVRVGDPAFAEEKSLDLLRESPRSESSARRLSELGISAYSVMTFSFRTRSRTRRSRGSAGSSIHLPEMSIAAVVGLPLKIRDALFNCAAVLFRGKDPRYRRSCFRTTGSSTKCAISSLPPTCPWIPRYIGTERHPLGSGPYFRGRRHPGFQAVL